MQIAFPTVRRLRCGIFILGLLAFSGNALSDELRDAKALLQEGKLTEALTKTDKLIEKFPADPSIQFVRGLILSEQKKTPEAIDVFSRLTTEHPDFPEPYNNLAVLFATDGQYVKARIALETALKLNPQYATAQENLGDVFLQSSLQAYVAAARLHNDTPGLRTKLRAVRGTLGLPLTDPASSPKSPAGSVVATATAATLPASTMQPVASASTTKQKSATGDRDMVLAVVDQWVKAWSNKDTKTYFSLYAPDFRTPHGESRGAWEKNRRDRINNKNQIDIQVLSPSVTVEDRTAIVNFQQVYVAGKISSNARKILTLKNDAGSWKIVQEKSAG